MRRGGGAGAVGAAPAGGGSARGDALYGAWGASAPRRAARRASFV